MTIYSFHLYDRNCEQIFTRTWKQGTQTLASSDLAKLIFGTTFSLRTTIRKLTPDSALENQGYFTYSTSTYSLHAFESLSGLRFVLLTSPPAKPPTSTVLHPNPSGPVELNYNVILRQIYERLYVEFVVKNPLSLVRLYDTAQVDHFNDVRFGKEGERTKQQVKRKKELESREGDVGGSIKGIGMVQGCELFSLALDQFLRSIDTP